MQEDQTTPDGPSATGGDAQQPATTPDDAPVPPPLAPPPPPDPASGGLLPPPAYPASPQAPAYPGWVLPANLVAGPRIDVASVLGRTFDTFGREWSLFLVLAVPAAVASLLQMLITPTVESQVQNRFAAAPDTTDPWALFVVERDRRHGGRGLGAGERGRGGPPVARRAGGHRRHDPGRRAQHPAGHPAVAAGGPRAGGRRAVHGRRAAGHERPADRRRHRPGRGADADRPADRAGHRVRVRRDPGPAVPGAPGGRARGGHAGERDPAYVARDPRPHDRAVRVLAGDRAVRVRHRVGRDPVPAVRRQPGWWRASRSRSPSW